MTRKICVFPNDPMYASYEKGEIKDRYFNPMNVFDEVHVITFCEKDVEERLVQPVAGSATLRIHPVGRVTIANLRFKRNSILRLVASIEPDIIRAFNPLFAGYLSSYCGLKLGVPSVISLHGDYDRDLRRNLWKRRKFFGYLKLYYSSKFIEPFALRNADKVICAYRFPLSYARKYGAKDIEVIYNRVSLQRFMTGKRKFPSETPVILCVGRLIPEKNQQCLIRAMPGLEAELLLIGDGPLLGHLQELAKKLNVADHVRFIRSVPHSEIPDYYASADIFAIPLIYGGISIPVLEAMAAGLPIVITKSEWVGEKEVTDEVAIRIENTPEAFHAAFRNLLADKGLRDTLGEKGRVLSRQFDEIIIERQEKEMFQKLMGLKKAVGR